VIKLLTRIALKVTVSGLELIPPSGPALLAINHINSIEGPLLYVTCPREIIGLGKVELWSNPITKPLAMSLKAIPLRRGEMDLNAVRLSLKVLQEGKVMGVAPEGTRSNHGRLQPARPGIVLLALRVPETPIVPVAIYGQEKYRKNLRRLRRTEVSIAVGQPFWLDPGDGRVTREMRQQMTDEIMMQIAALLPPQNRGVYSNLGSATEDYLRFEAGTESSLQRALRSMPPASEAVDHGGLPAGIGDAQPLRGEGSQ
jgi:1-acyl-sn-glycerol-3-phosphate acyltransferase